MAKRTSGVPICALLFGLSLALGSSAHGTLIEQLPFDGNANATVGTDGTLSASTANLPTFVADRNNNANGAVAFNGSNNTDKQYVNVAGGGGLNNLQVGTMAFFVRWNGLQPPGFNGAGTSGTVTARQNNGVFSDDVITLDGADPNTAKIDFRLASATANSLVSTVSPGDGAWHHLAVTFDQTAHVQQLYIDGVLNATGTDVGSVHNDAAVALSIGAFIGDGANYSASNIDDFRVYDTVLSQAQIQAIASTPEPASGLLVAIGVVGLLLGRVYRARGRAGCQVHSSPAS